MEKIVLEIPEEILISLKETTEEFSFYLSGLYDVWHRESPLEN